LERLPHSFTECGFTVGDARYLLPMLPLTVERLRIPCGPLTANDILHLPPALKLLIIGDRGLSNGIEDWKLLPKTLTYLRIDPCPLLVTESSL